MELQERPLTHIEATRPGVQGLGVCFSKKSRKLFGPGKPSKISNLRIKELFYSHMLNINRGSLIQDVSGEYFSPFLDTDTLKMALPAQIVSGTFEKQASISI